MGFINLSCLVSSFSKISPKDEEASSSKPSLNKSVNSDHKHQQEKDNERKKKKKERSRVEEAAMTTPYFAFHSRPGLR
ncbi:hypothetical protein IHE45_04G028800 [Dioscorea alata]|uniref:Uncharacterized protein n=1 Tax=Dioscorea alata TaxID=55571 RepID=A0ACB7WAX4_DIOAL|nr:hypothetical protein IHE45_04G028800 [Dioscorea alata]